jgi:hypothetical protein
MRENRVTEDELLSSIVETTYTVLPNGRTTECQLTLYNGFTVEGSSACVSAENYNQIIGERIAHQNAFDKLWQLFGFLLAEKLYQERVGHI